MRNSGRGVRNRRGRKSGKASQLQLFEAPPREQCLKYDTCCAPLCPMDRQSLKRGVWHVDEEICSSGNFARLTWIEKQRKLARTGDPEESLSYDMLRTAGPPAQAPSPRVRRDEVRQIALHQTAVSGARKAQPAGRQKPKPPATRRTRRSS